MSVHFGTGYDFGQNGSIFTNTTTDVVPPDDRKIIAIQFLSDTTFATNTRVYVTPASGQTIDGNTNYYEINKEYEGIQMWSDGTEWFIIQKKA